MNPVRTKHAAIATATENADKPTAEVVLDRGQRLRQRVRRMCIINIDRRARWRNHSALKPTTHWLKPRNSVENLALLCAGRESKPCRNQRIGGLIGTD